MSAQTSPIADLVTRVDSSGPPRDQLKFVYIDLSSVDAAGKSIDKSKTIAIDNAPSRARQVVRAGDVLVSTVRPNLNGVARVPERFDRAIASTGFCVLRSRPAVIDPQYLFNWVRSPVFVKNMTRLATGASYPAVSDAIVKASSIPLPPLPEQRRIAAILDQADELRAKRRSALALLDELADSIFIDMFGDPAMNPRDWPLSTVGSLAIKYSDGPFGSNLKSSDYAESGVRVIRLQNIGVGKFVDNDRAFISESHFRTISKHECVPGDVIIGTLGVPNLRACLLPDAVLVAVNKADCVQFRADEKKVTPRFVVGLLNRPSVGRMAQSLVQGQTRARISMGRLRGLQVPVPGMELQIEYSARIEQMEQAKSQQFRQLAAADELFASLQHRAFRGEL